MPNRTSPPYTHSDHHGDEQHEHTYGGTGQGDAGPLFVSGVAGLLVLELVVVVVQLGVVGTQAELDVEMAGNRYQKKRAGDNV